MSTNHTANYQLNLWEAGDDFIRSEFNADNTKLDAALADLNIRKLDYVMGLYHGNQTANRVFDLGFRPKILIVKSQNDYRDYGYANEVCHVPVIVITGSQNRFVTLLDNGFQITEGQLVNDVNTDFFYIAYQ